MAIIGIETLIYGVESVKLSTQFFEDFGLKCHKKNDGGSDFKLPEGSKVLIRDNQDPSLLKSELVGYGVREVIWGVDTEEALEDLVTGLSVDRDVMRDDDGTAHFLTDFGIAMGLRIFVKKPVVCAPDPLNAPGSVGRLNQHRKWRQRAYPKTIAHVVFAIPEYEKGFIFMRDRLNFRLSDTQRGFGKYMRADGSNSHHNIFLVNANIDLPGMDGKVRFHHANFGLEDIDEVMIGANHMTRKGWPDSHLGLGRHRIDSALFYYLPCPAGGEAEYGADADYIDDSWVPRDWTEPLFGYAQFVHNLPPFLAEPPKWELSYLTEDDTDK